MPTNPATLLAACTDEVDRLLKLCDARDSDLAAVNLMRPALVGYRDLLVMLGDTYSVQTSDGQWLRTYLITLLLRIAHVLAANSPEIAAMIEGTL
jgi:UDP-glucose 4-epimerase